MNVSVVGKPLGRPKTRWLDQTNKDTIELHAENLKTIAQEWH